MFGRPAAVLLLLSVFFLHGEANCNVRVGARTAFGGQRALGRPGGCFGGPNEPLGRAFGATA